MQPKIFTYFIITLCTLTLISSVHGQTLSSITSIDPFPLSSTTTIEQLDAFAADLSERSANLTTDEFQAYSERQWASEELSQISRLLGRYTSSADRMSRGAELEDQWNSVRSQILALTTENLNNFLEAEYRSLLRDLNKASFRYDSDRFDTYDELFKIIQRQPLSAVFRDGEFVRPPNNQADQIIIELQYLRQKKPENVPPVKRF